MLLRAVHDGRSMRVHVSQNHYQRLCIAARNPPTPLPSMSSLETEMRDVFKSSSLLEVEIVEHYLQECRSCDMECISTCSYCKADMVHA